ncbi:type II secretion system protein [Cyanobium sp. FACHB-13342]|nr:type II secretion system protein [Cyanobium sp. FACHB-13342]
MELLVVVIIIAILAGLSAGAVIRYSNKARVSSAKAVVASAARECLRWMLDSEGQPLVLGTSAGEGFTLSQAPECGSSEMVKFNVTIDVLPGSSFGVEVNPDGTLQRVCTGSVDCQGGRW